MTTKKILIITPALSGGGAERVAVNLANEWRQKKCAVTLLSIRDINDYMSAIHPGVRVLTIGARRVRYSIFELRRKIREIDPDMILSVMRSTNILTAAALPLSVRARVGFREANPLHALRNLAWYRQTAMVGFMRIAYKRAHAIIANSPDTLDDLRASSIALRNGRVVFNPVISSSVYRGCSGPAPHLWLADPNVKVVVSAGRLHYQKDYFTLLRAFSRLAKEKGSVRLLILGKGEEEEALKKFAVDLGISWKVGFLGFVENPWVYMKHADVFALSSRWEGFGNVLVESFACGTPVVATDCSGGPRIITQDGALGRLVPVGDDVEFANALADTLDEPPSRMLLETRAKEFSVETIAKEYWEALWN